MIRYILFLIILLSFGACKKKATNPNEPRLLWEKSLAVNEQGRFSFVGAIYDNEGFLTNYAENGKSYFCKLSNINGAILWKEEYLHTHRAILVSLGYTDGENAIFIADKVYIVNLKSGKATTTNSRDGYNVVVRGIDDIAFLSRTIESNDNTWKSVGYFINMSTGVAEPFLQIDIPEPKKFPDGRIGGVYRLFPYKNKLNEIELIVYYYIATKDGVYESDELWGRYNFTNKKWIYKGIPVKALVMDAEVNTEEDWVIIADGRSATGYALSTGEQKWQQTMKFGYQPGGTVVYEDLLIGTNQEPYITAHNVHNGNLIWKHYSGSTTSEHIIVNGVLYYAAGGNGTLYAREAATGEILWEIYKGINKELKVIPGKNGEKAKIIACSFTHAYCYEAIR